MFAFGRRGRARSIQFWLTWLVVACILPAALGAAFLLVQSYKQARTSLETARIGVAHALVQVLDSELAGAASVLQVLALSPLIASGDFSGFQDAAAGALTTTAGNVIVLSRRDGAQIVNTLRPFGTPLPAYGDAELRRRTLEAGKPVISDVFNGPVIKRPLVAVQVPVVVDGQTKYLLTLAFFSERLSELLLRQNLPAGWVAAIYDRNGTIAARTQAAAEFVGKPGAAAAVRQVAMRTEGAFDTNSLEGVPMHSTFSRSAFSGWAVIIAVPASLAAGRLEDSLWLNAAVAVTALLLGAALARRIGRRIAQSITALGVPAPGTRGGGVLPAIDIIEVDALRTVLLKAAQLVEQERNAARDAERRMVLAAESAEHANRAKSEFLASMSHELRTPLHGILGHAELIGLEGKLNPGQSQHLKVMLAAGGHLLGMINAVLDLSQIEASQLELQPETIELSALIGVCLDVVRPAAEKKAIALGLPPVTPLRLVADPTRLRQVLVNLLGNAIKFTAVGKVEVRLAPIDTAARIRLEVVDTGPGIPPEHRAKLFQSFERLDSNALRAIEGVGLGLALSAHLVALMGGRLGHAENPAGGSIFWLELPLGNVAAPAAPSTPAKASPAPDPIPLHALHVLVVDDVAINRDIASSFLRVAGHRVTSVQGGVEAIEAVTNTDFSVVLMDVRMPGMNGLEAARRIRLLPGRCGRVPIVAVTAQAFTDQVTECRNAGMDSHLGKPFDQATLLATVARAAESRPAVAMAHAASPL